MKQRWAGHKDEKERALQELAARSGSAFTAQMAKEKIKGPSLKPAPPTDRFEGKPTSEHMREQYAGETKRDTKRKRQRTPIKAEVFKRQGGAGETLSRSEMQGNGEVEFRKLPATTKRKERERKMEHSGRQDLVQTLC